MHASPATATSPVLSDDKRMKGNKTVKVVTFADSIRKVHLLAG